MNRFYEFETFRVDAEKRRLWNEGKIVSINPKTFDTLLALLKNKNEVIGKDKLIEEIWNGVAVSDDSLTQQISQLRKLLGDSADEHKFIVTVSGIGYKFVADVNKIQTLNGYSKIAPDLPQNGKIDITPELSASKNGNLPEKELNQQQKSQEISEKLKFERKRNWMTAFAVFSIFGLAAVFFWQNYKPEKTNALGVKKIAVLPFRAISPDEQTNALKQGMTDSLVTNLSRIDKLNVLPSVLVGDYQNSEQSPLEFGRKIGADAVLDGGIRKNGEQIIVNVQLFDTSDGKILWSDSFQNEFTDILEVQNLITNKIAEALSLELSDEEKLALMKRYTTSTEAYRLFLDAYYLKNKRSGSEALIQAEKNYKRAIDLDPNFALAYVELANLQVYSPSPQSYERMKFLARKAIEIDESLGEAHDAYGFAVWRGDWNWQEAETHFLRAIELSPNSLGGYGSLSMILLGQGKFNEAVKTLDSQNPPDLNTKIYKITVYFFSRDYEKVISESRKFLSQNPNDIPTLSYLAPAYSFKGMHAEAIETAEKYAALDETAGVGSLVYLSLAYIKAGQVEKGKEILQRIWKKNASDSAQIHGGLAMLYGELGEKEKAFEQLEKSIENREWWAFTLKVAPYYDSLRDDVRFQEMLRQVNLDN